MRVLITSVGSHGDINPFVAVARALQARGHAVLFAGNPYFGGLLAEAGVSFEPLGEAFDLRELAEHPDVMHHWRGPMVVVRELMAPHIRATFERLPGLIARFRPGVVLHHHICLGVPWVCERVGVPTATGVLAPMMWLTRSDRLMIHPKMSHNAPLWLSSLLGWMIRRGTKARLDGLLNELRRDLGLPPATDIFRSVARGGTINLGLWSPEMRAPLPDDPAHGIITGFAWYDRHAEQEHAPADVEAFLNEGEPPILFSLGTAAVHVAGDFYGIAAEVCRRLNRRGLLLVGRAPHAAPRSLPPGVRVFTYAPFSALMPRVAASVHHGGIGTCGQSLRAGRPVVVVPHAHDQFDNAARLRRMRLARSVPAKGLTASKLAEALGRVLTEPDWARFAAQAAERVAKEDGATAAAKAIEGLAE